MQDAIAIAARAAGWWTRRAGPWWSEALHQLLLAERGRFMLWLPVFMCAGVVAQLTALEEPAWWLGGGAFVLACVVFALARPFPPVRAMAACVGAVALGLASAQSAIERAPPLLDVPRKATVITGRIRLVEPLPEGQRITIEALHFDGGPEQARRVRVRLRKTDPAELFPGDTVRVRALVRAPSPPSYPGGWDLQRDTFFQGIGGYGYAISPATVVDHASPNGAGVWLHGLRKAIAARAMAAVPGTTGAIAATLLTGLTSAIPEADKAAFRDSGLAHLLAIAGLHIGIVMGLALGLARFALGWWEWAALRWPTKKIAVLFALAVGGTYMLLTGSHVPIVRSFSMACLVALATLLGRRAISVRGLGIAGVVIMLLSPNEVLGVSFQLSFSAVLALIAGYEALRGPLRRLRGNNSTWRVGLHHIAALALTSALAGTASAPFGAYHFGRFQLYYVLANMIAVPITASWVMPAGLIALMLMPFGLEWLPFIAMSYGIEAILWIGRTVSSLPAAVFPVPHIATWGLVLVSLGIAWLGIWRTRWRLLGVPVIALGLLSPAFVQPPDILVSADGRMIAVRTRDGVMLEEKTGNNGFTRDAWSQYLGVRDMAPIQAVGEVDGIDCDAAACGLHPRAGGSTALLVRGRPSDAACDAAALVSLEPIRLRCGFFVPWVDRFSVWRDGAHAIWLDPAGPRIVSDRDVRGTRPWVPQSPRARDQQTDR